jgi:transcription antitermination factor NusG
MWCVVHTAANAEAQVCRLLTSQGLSSYAPEFRRVRRTQAGSVRDRRHHWIFPRYVFFRLSDGFAQWDVVRWAPGVIRVLQQGNGPALLEDAVMDHLRTRLADTEPRHPGRTFRPGQRVVVEDGPLVRVEALFDRCLTAHDRVVILVQLLGRLVPVEVDPGDIRAA